jgi:hypothetical protein
MLALLIGTAVVGLVLILGLALAVGYALQPGPHADAGRSVGTATSGLHVGGHGSAGGTAVDPRDALATKPMTQVDDSASHPGAESTHDPGAPILLPAQTGTGPAGVPTGFPHTAGGAMAQLAAIDQVTMQSGSVATARQVILQWALPGGPTPDTWSTLQALVHLLSSAQSGGTSQIAIVLSPLMGQLKGNVGPDFVIPCIDFELDITLTSTARGAVADCQRMVWQPTPTGTTGRWMIGPGTEPAEAPAVWPGTDLSFAVGYSYLQQEPAR